MSNLPKSGGTPPTRPGPVPSLPRDPDPFPGSPSHPRFTDAADGWSFINPDRLRVNPAGVGFGYSREDLAPSAPRRSDRPADVRRLGSPRFGTAAHADGVVR